MPTEPSRVGQQRRKPLHPPVHGDVVDVDAAFGQEFLHIPVGQAEPQVPPHRQHDHVRREAKPGERRASRNRLHSTQSRSHAAEACRGALSQSTQTKPFDGPVGDGSTGEVVGEAGVDPAPLFEAVGPRLNARCRRRRSGVELRAGESFLDRRPEE
jgi:hypothetical protein